MGDTPLRWESVVWPDKTAYEGLSMGEDCHVRGVLSFSDGSYYAGEFNKNAYSGFGVYTWPKGPERETQVCYRGEWSESRANGCGVRLTKNTNGKVTAEEGEFLDDEWLGPTKACSVKAAREAARFADVAGQMANAFRLGDGGARDGGPAVKAKGADKIIEAMNRFDLTPAFYSARSTACHHAHSPASRSFSLVLQVPVEEAVDGKAFMRNSKLNSEESVVADRFVVFVEPAEVVCVQESGVGRVRRVRRVRRRIDRFALHAYY